MPNRILKESILTSASVQMLTCAAERFFYRLLTVADDFGRFDARPAVIRGRLFPLKLRVVSDKNIGDWMKELLAAGIIRLYGARGASGVTDCQFFEFVNFTVHQGAPRAKRSRFPAPEIICEQMPAYVPVSVSVSDIRSPISDIRGSTRAGRAPPPPKTGLAESGFAVDEELVAWATTELIHPLTELEVRNATEEFSEYWGTERASERKGLDGWRRTWRNKMRWLSEQKARKRGVA